MDLASTSDRSSGIPRLSKLPTPRTLPTVSAYAENEDERKLHKVGSRASLRLSSKNTGSRTNLRQPIPLESLGHNRLNSVLRSSNRGKENHEFKKPEIPLPPSQQRPLSSNGVQAAHSTGPRERKHTFGNLEARVALQSPSTSTERKSSLSREYGEPDRPAEAAFQTPKPDRKSRPSLSDRTIESLSQISPSPGCGRRTSNFFSPESPMNPTSRPVSAMESRIRPGTSDGNYGANTFIRPGSPSKRSNISSRTSFVPGSIGSTPSKRSVSAGLPRPASTLRKPSIAAMSSLPAPFEGLIPNESTMVKEKGNVKACGASKTVAARFPKPRPGLESAFDRPKRTTTTVRPSSASKSSASEPMHAEETIRKVSNSSAILREQIARAKAARRLPASHRSRLLSDEQSEVSTDAFDGRGGTDKGLLRKRIESARSDGRLNIAAMSLRQIPVEVTTMYDMDAMESSSMAWNEMVDLTRFNAADNELEELQDDVFPDTGADDNLYDNDAKANIFRALEAVDLHGNLLRTVPLGLRQLEWLRYLNLSNNKMGNSSLDVIVQLANLRDLRLGGNQLTGALPDNIGRLKALESLDVHNNKLLSLPGSLRELVSLRILNVAGNQLASLPMKAVAALPLIELLAAHNSLHGDLFLDAPRLWPRLQTLDVAGNRLSSLVPDGTLELPMLRNLNVSNNRLDALPDISQWSELLNLQAENNQIIDLPAGFTKLKRLRTVNLDSNSISKLDDQIASMDNLEILRVGNNPLRDRRYLTMNTEDVKADMRRRLQPSPSDGVAALADETTDTWCLTKNKRLDLSFKSLEDINPDILGTFLVANTVRHMYLHHNNFTSTPVCLVLAQDLKTLDISNNLLEPALIAPLLLPQLNELILSNNKLTSFFPITSYLTAPDLRVLDVRCNRITGPLPILRQRFKNLNTLLAADNAVTEISVDSLKGLESLDLSRNDIAHLPPEIGLLAGTLRSFSVGGNTFKVPRYTVLEKGTEATLAWLRDKLPAKDGGVEKEGTGGSRERSAMPAAAEAAPDWGPGLLGAWM